MSSRSAAAATGHASAADESSEVSELGFLLNGGTPSKRQDRAHAQEEQKRVLPPPTASELRVMAVQSAVEALKEHVSVASVVLGCCERWQALGYGPGRRQSAFEAGALPAIVAGMNAHPAHAVVQEKGCLAIANICSGTDESGLARKADAFDAGAVPAIVAALVEHAEAPAVQAGGSAALGNVCFAADLTGLARKHAAHEAGAIAPIARAIGKFGSDAAVCENGAFALGNLCRALGKVGHSGVLDESSPELAPIDDQMRLRGEGQQRKACAADAGALEALIAAMRAHENNPGIQEWGARALSIITYESTPLRERAKGAGAKMVWLMGLSESMDAAKKAATTPVSKTGRQPVVAPNGRPTGRAIPGSVRG